jgi:hypothetical protein
MHTKSKEAQSCAGDHTRVSICLIHPHTWANLFCGQDDPSMSDDDVDRVFVPANTVVLRTSLRVSPEVAASHWLDFRNFVDGGGLPLAARWDNTWLCETDHRLYLFQPCDQPGDDDAEPAGVSALGMEPVEISACAPGQVVFVTTFLRDGAYVFCCPVIIIGKQLVAEPVAA